jgi:hypothetical protein
MIQYKNHNENQRFASLTLASLIFFESFFPSYLWAKKVANHMTPYFSEIGNSVQSPLESSSSVKSEIEETISLLPPAGAGPDQPEVQSFMPINVSDMVDPFTGDFSYNIPLLEIDGYPINLAYQAGVTMDQEASWVGLGWNLNPGVLNRALRGVPDDFNGSDKMEKEMSIRPNNTTSIHISSDIEGFGVPILKILSPNLGLTYNNYNGASASFGFSFSHTFPISKTSQLTAGLGFNGDSQSGAGVSPSLAYSKKTEAKDKQITNKLNIGAPFNTRGGFESISMSYSRTTEKVKSVKYLELYYFKLPIKVTKSSSALPMGGNFNLGNTVFNPNVSMPMLTTGATFSFKLGLDVFGIDPTLPVRGTISSSFLYTKNQQLSMYGYNHLAKAENDDKAILDFSRENDGGVSKNTPALSNSSLTYDVYSPSGHGISGSYRPIRNEVGYVYDPKMSSYSANGTLGLENSLGSIAKQGFDIGLTYCDNVSQAWDEVSNAAARNIQFKDDDLVYKEASELSVAPNYQQFLNMGGEMPVRFGLKSVRALTSNFENDFGNTFSSNGINQKQKEIRNQVMYPISVAELVAGLGIEELPASAYAKNNLSVGHHNGQYTILNAEGSRYVYGIPAYSHLQKSVSFSVEQVGIDYLNGTVPYDNGIDNSTSNKLGTDHYFSSETTPPFAHSYLLTSVLNADYIDSDNIKGPSKGDLGGYVKFTYKQIPLFKWRIPLFAGKASFDEGLNTDGGDNKANYTYGEKELWYIEQIISKNHIAVFYSSPRADGAQMDEAGNILANVSKMLKLDSVALYSLPDYMTNHNPIPIKVAHFEYDYSLCTNFPLNNNPNTAGGKLTLKRLYFTYQNSNKGRFSAYKFSYSDVNPSYSPKSVNKWGGYKPFPSNYDGDIESDPLRPSDFPYVSFNKADEDLHASAWNLKQIQLPSGGRIEVDYEVDDFGFVQHKRAMQMFKIVGVETANSGRIIGNQVESLSSNDLKNAKLYFELLPNPNGGFYTNINDYIPKGELIYFRALMDFGGKFDFVPGFAEHEEVSIEVVNNVPYGVIKFKGEKLNDNGPAQFNPISVAAVQFGRLQLNKFLPPSNFGDITDDDQPNILDGLAGMFVSYGEFFTGPNRALWNADRGTKIALQHSWLRLFNPSGNKLGGGHRVKEIRIYDAWDELTNNEMEGFYYGQQYIYADENGRSTGVAAYEPMLGGDENVFRKPVTFSNRNILAPDESNYQIEPYGEQFFPTASVGYASVTIKNLQRNNVTRNATGKVVHEFYTAKDFPTFAARTTMDFKRLKIPSVNFFFGVMVDAMSASQGFVVQTNNMHGKPKSQVVFAEGKTDTLSSVRYLYKSKQVSYDGQMVSKLENELNTIDEKGNLSLNQVGINFEGVADFRKNVSKTISGSLDYNVNTTYGLPVIIVPSVIPSGSFENKTYKGATFTKVIERSGIQDVTIAKDLGSVVKTKNLAFDARTGSVLLSETQTNFNDNVYNLSFPAHWYYQNMGQAYNNIDFEKYHVSFVNGSSVQINSQNAVVGDEVYLANIAQAPILAWVVEANEDGVRLLDKQGQPINGNFYLYRVLRSGRKNVQTTPIGTITLRKNPLNGIKNNLYEDVLQASSVEFSDEWRTFCDCFISDEENEFTSVNPYVSGIKGNWRPVASYLHLSGRNQHYIKKNTDLRNDGFMTSFTPFYRLDNGKWRIFRDNWTYTSSVTEFSPFGQALETKDALNRFTASQFGYNQTFAIAIGANTRYKQLGYDGFEDYNFDNCSDNHFRFANNTNQLTPLHAHTGSYGILVNKNQTVTLTKPLSDGCDLKPCNLSVMELMKETAEEEYQVLGGTLPLEIEPNIIDGNPTLTINKTGDKFHIQSTQAFSVDFRITDAKGCQQLIHLKKD